MEAKLAAYRANKAKQKRSEQSLLNRLKARLLGSQVNVYQAKCDSKASINETVEKSQPEELTAVQKEISVEANTVNPPQELYEDFAEPTKSEIVTKWILRVCKLALWLCLWGLFIELQFGAVFFTVSVIIFTYINTRTGPRDGRLSAYSVFNKDCKRIQGTLTAEQMQKNMFGVPGVTS